MTEKIEQIGRGMEMFLDTLVRTLQSMDALRNIGDRKIIEIPFDEGYARFDNNGNVNFRYYNGKETIYGTIQWGVETR